MKKYFLVTLLFYLLLLSSACVYAQNIDAIAEMERQGTASLFKTYNVQYPGDQRYDVKYYKLDLTFSTSPNNLIGRVNVYLSFLISTNAIFLDFTNALTIDSVLVNNTPVSFTRETSKLNITLNREYSPGELINVFVKYRGVPSTSGFGSFTFGTHAGAPAIFTLSEPYGAKDWFPGKDTPADKADSADIWITCPDNLKGISNGTLIAEINNGNGTKTFKWKESYPIAQYLISIAISNYVVQNLWFRYSETDSMPVTNYMYAENLTVDNIQILNKTPQYLKYFSDAFGLYPFIREKYSQVNFGWGGGMEHQTATSIGGAIKEEINVHELAHQWFGDKITCRNWHHVWLNEGFATWCTGYYYGGAYGQSDYKNYMNDQMISAKSVQGSVWIQDTSNIDEIFNYARSYAKGSVILHMLRGITGDQQFFHIMRDYINNPQLAYGTAVTEDFQRVAETVTGSSLEYFFHEWIYGEGYPKYTLNWNYQHLSGDQYNININLSQASGTNPSFFTMPVQIKVNTNLGDTLLTFFNDQQSQQFNVIVNGLPVNLVFDPEDYILKDINITSGIDDEVKPQLFSLEQNYPNPFNPSTTISYKVPVKSLVTIKVFDLLGREVEMLLNEEKEAGSYRINFKPGQTYSSGIYFYTLQAGDRSITKKMMIIK